MQNLRCKQANFTEGRLSQHTSEETKGNCLEGDGYHRQGVVINDSNRNTLRFLKRSKAESRTSRYSYVGLNLCFEFSYWGGVGGSDADVVDDAGES